MWIHRLLLVFLITFSFSAQAGLYRWVDEEGTVHYDDEIPEGQAVQPVLIPEETSGINVSTPTQRESFKQSLEKKPDLKVEVLENPEATPTNQGRMDRSLNETICLYRFSLSCDELMQWKQTAKELCERKHRSGLDCSGHPLLGYRPSGITMKTLARGFPFNDGLSKADQDCLATNGFYCDELQNEAYCEERFGQSCEKLRNWPELAVKNCQQRRELNCGSKEMYAEQRPKSFEEWNYLGRWLPLASRIRQIDLMMQVDESLYQTTEEFERILTDRFEQLPGDDSSSER